MLGLWTFCAFVVYPSFAIFENDIYSEQYLNCCDNYTVIESEGLVTCSKTVHKSGVASSLDINCTNGEHCMGHMQESTVNVSVWNLYCYKKTYIESTNKTYPKCCPPEYIYNKLEHVCMILSANDSFDDDFGDELLYLKGLTNCSSVIIDYDFKNITDVISTSSKTVSLPNLNHSYPLGDYCFDRQHGSSSRYVLRACHQDLDVCRRRIDDLSKPRCIRKCCPDGQFYLGGKKCVPSFSRGFGIGNDTSVARNDEHFAVVIHETCRKYPGVKNTYKYTMDEVGDVSLLLEDGNYKKFSSVKVSYCREYAEVGNLNDHYGFFCFAYIDKDRSKFIISRIVGSLSCIFLVITLLGYAILPDMQNLHGKTLMCHCASMLAVFGGILGVQSYPQMENSCICTLVGYLIMYTSLAAFSWLNLMCFDIWWTFGSLRVQTIWQKKQERKRFAWYNLYGWSLPLLITLIAYLTQRYQLLPENFLPAVGFYKCFFEKEKNPYAFLIFFLLPVTCLIICNFVLFIKTILYCSKVKQEINKMKDSNTSKKERHSSFNADKERLSMISKLFIVMGVSWLFEIISAGVLYRFFNKYTFLEYVDITFDTYNHSQGILIFCIFILKPKVVRAIKSKIGFLSFSRRSSQSVMSSFTTTSKLQSTKISNTEF